MKLGTLIAATGALALPLALVPAAQASSPAIQTVDDREMVRVAGPWRHVDRPVALDGTLTRGLDRGARMRTPDGVIADYGATVSYEAGPRRGNLRVYVGGELQAVVDTRAPSRELREVVVDGAGPVRLVVGRPRARGVFVDAVQVTYGGGACCDPLPPT